MKNNRGVTLIVLVITIIVIILISSITIYSGMDTINKARKKNATDTTNAIYMALISNEDIIPVEIGEETTLIETKNEVTRQLTNEDFKLLGLDYTTNDCKVTFTRSFSGDYTVVYSFIYTDNLNNTYTDIPSYVYNIDAPVTTSKAGFDTVKKVNRPVLNISGMTALDYNNENVYNVYTDNWYNYEKGFSKLAIAEFNGKTYAWIPRFAYRIQNFYIGKNYNNVPATAVDIIFLRDNSSYMANDEVLDTDFIIHPAFSNGETGFWITTEALGIENSIDNAIYNTSGDYNGVKTHLMKNSEYAATVLLLKYLGNTDIIFENIEFVGAIFNSSQNNFDEYSTDQADENYYLKIKGHALSDTPWDITEDIVAPEGDKVCLARNVDRGGFFYYEAVTRNTSASYRMTIPE